MNEAGCDLDVSVSTVSLDTTMDRPYLGCRKSMARIALIISIMTLMSCSSMPSNIVPVSNFELQRYMGKWYEIARLDHRFERGLNGVTATYSIEVNGTVRVENRGFSSKDQEWKTAVGKAKIAKDPELGYLKVSFFGPFYGPYVIFNLDTKNYQYAYVTSGQKYLWFLSRTPDVSEEMKEDFIDTAKKYGYETDNLIFVKHVK